MFPKPPEPVGSENKPLPPPPPDPPFEPGNVIFPAAPPPAEVIVVKPEPEILEFEPVVAPLPHLQLLL